MRKEGFSERIRIKKEHEFRRIIRNGTKMVSGDLIVFRLQNAGIEGQKFGIKIARGTRTAVERNKIKRVIREFLRKNKDRFAKNEGVVVMYKSTAGVADLRELKEKLASLIRPEGAG